MNTIAQSILSTTTEGVNLQPGSLRDQLGEKETLLIFLRHFG